jgi:FeS assembly SUF system regulator
MLRIGKLTDYAMILMVYFVQNPDKKIYNATELSRETHVSLPTVIKVLKTLSRGHLLEAHRGLRGGYSLARQPEKVSISEIVHAMEGPLTLTSCCQKNGVCDLKETCTVRKKWPQVNGLVLSALRDVSLNDMACK